METKRAIQDVRDEADEGLAGHGAAREKRIAGGAGRSVRRLLRRVWIARSAWHLALALRDVARYGPRRVKRWLEAEFHNKPDPWGYTRRQEQLRMQSAMALLDEALAGRRPGRALEIGCAEGFCTPLLAARCGSVLAVDFSELALARARERNRGNKNVNFRRWDLLRDPLPEGRFDLVVIMGVLELVFRRKQFALARDRLVSLLAADGYLLVSNSRTGEVSEQARWGRWLIRGGKWINAFVAEHPALREVSTQFGDFYVHTLLRKL